MKIHKVYWPDQAYTGQNWACVTPVMEGDKQAQHEGRNLFHFVIGGEVNVLTKVTFGAGTRDDNGVLLQPEIYV